MVLLTAMGAADSVLNDRAGAQRHQPRRHLLIAGTGRAGTSVLVQYLSGLGLETHLTKNGDAANWHDTAQAGLEDLPISAAACDLPYVIKSPWSYQIIDQVLADPRITLDAVIIPIRDLIEAAASRSIVQLQTMHQNTPWLTQIKTTFEDWGAEPGGTVFSLNPVDQARLVAFGFHRLLERMACTDVPTVLIGFSRAATDPDYLFRKLHPVLPIDISVTLAREVHAATFCPAKMRTGRELTGEMRPAPDGNGLAGPSITGLENAALKRELERLRSENKTLRRSASRRLTRRARAIRNSLQSLWGVLRQ